MIICDAVVIRSEIPEILAEYSELIDDFFRYKEYGDPYGGIGWRNWPAHVLDTIDALSVAEGKWLESMKVK